MLVVLQQLLYSHFSLSKVYEKNEKLYTYPNTDLEDLHKELIFTLNNMESIGEIFL